LSSFIACPDCKHQLTLPEHFVGQRVQCPKCLVEFQASATPTLAMEVEPQAQPADAKPAANNTELAKKDSNLPPLLNPPVETAYAPAHSTPSQSTAPSARQSIYCSECGTKFSRAEDTCPSCGYRIQDSLDHPPFVGRRPRARMLEPIPAYLPVLGAILVPVGLAFLIGAVIVVELMHRKPPPLRDVVPFSILAIGILVEITALVLCFSWLHRAWRLVLHGDEEFSPGLMVGLLFVPFFNLYWMFRAIPGLSAAIQQELKLVAPRRTYGAGWVPGEATCILALVPYMQPVAVCFFLAWMLIANNAINRLVRFHEELRAEGNREADDLAESVEVANH
jgi:hypothetical protein